MSKHLSTSRRARGLVASFAAVALGFTGLVAIATTASATVSEVCRPDPGRPYIAPTYETIVVTPAHWQRYSYKGQWDSNTEAPPFPDNRWQDNVAGDPHQIGVAGAYFKSQGNSGNGDWFYLEWVAAVTKVQTNPGQEYIAPTICPEPPFVRVTFLCKATQDGPVLNTGTSQAFATGDYIFRIREEAGVGTSWTAGVGGSGLFSGTIPASTTEFYAAESPVAGVSVKTSPVANLYGGTASTNETSCNYRPSVVTEWHTWQTSLAGETNPPTNGSHVTWPQTYVGAGQIAPTQCGVWYQQDLYEGTREAIDAVLADGHLTDTPGPGYEDAGLVKDWRFVYGGDCPVPEPSVTFSHVVPTCEAPGSVAVTTTEIPDTWWYGLRVEVDGVKVGGNVGAVPGLSSVAVQGPGTSALPLTFTEDQGGGEVTVRYFVTDATEYDLVPAAMDNSATWPEAGEGTFVEFRVNTDCLGEQDLVPVEIDPPAVTAPTCEAEGTVDYADGIGYTWDFQKVHGIVTLTAEAEDGYVIPDQAKSVWEFDLSKLTGEVCLSETPVIPQTPVVPTVVKQATLAETGFPLLGVLGLAGSLSLVGGGLLNARRLLRKGA
jgi:hypothetical protein